MAFSSQDIEVNGIRLNVIIEGSGPDVLMIHGFPDSKEVWSEQIPALVDAGYRVIAPDTRGIGDSELLPHKSDYHMSKLVEDMRCLLDALNIDKVKLIAHDWGAGIGWQLAMHHPERIERYIALSVGHPAAYMSKGGILQKIKGWYTLFFQLPFLPEWYLKGGNWSFLRMYTRAFSDKTDAMIEKLKRPGRLTAGINYYRANLSVMVPENLAALTIPVMGVHSTDDNFVTEAQMRNSSEFVNAPFRFESLEGVGHWMQVEAPEKVNALLLDYLKETIEK